MSKEYWHLWPINDTSTHIESVNCSCNPQVTEESDGILVVHNSFNGQEFYEKAESELKENKN